MGHITEWEDSSVSWPFSASRLKALQLWGMEGWSDLIRSRALHLQSCFSALPSAFCFTLDFLFVLRFWLSKASLPDLVVCRINVSVKRRLSLTHFGSKISWWLLVCSLISLQSGTQSLDSEYDGAYHGGKVKCLKCEPTFILQSI